MGAAVGETTSVRVYVDAILVLTLSAVTDVSESLAQQTRTRMPLGTSSVKLETDFMGSTLNLTIPELRPDVSDFIHVQHARAYERVRPNITVEVDVYYPETGETRTTIHSDLHMEAPSKSVARNADNTYTLSFRGGEPVAYG